MIYKCNNCGRNYNLKPDFCECGNNEFVEVVENFDYSTVKTDFNSGKDVDFLYAQNDSNSDEQESQDVNAYENDLKKQRTSEIVAIVVFVVVLITALIMIFSNVSALLKKSQEKTASVEIESYIPSDVNEYWTESKSVNTSTQSARQSNNTNSVNVNNSKFLDVSKVSKVSKTEKTSGMKQNSKPISQPNKNINSSNTVKITQKKSPENQKTQIVAKNTNSVSKSLNKPDSTISVEEYLRYKNSLRNRLFANFPILTVQGQGSAKVAFSVAADGKLTNRRFVSQSGNKSLDDAMYHMLMRVPVYSPPPSGFEGREIVMSMDFNNGHYSFAFVN